MLVAGWPSGVAHTVSGSAYAIARAAAFMAKVIAERQLDRRLAHLAELSPHEIAAIDHDALPPTMTGGEFASRYGGVDDPLSRIDANHTYPVRAAAEFATGENGRAAAAVDLLRAGAARKPADIAAAIGDLMHRSHLGYSGIGLGSPETDAMVEELRQRGPSQGFFGARVSGGGCGGTVVVLLAEAALPALHRLTADMTGTSVIT